MDNETGECFISVDVETSGPIPSEFSLLSIGASVIMSSIEDAGETFYTTLKPLEGAGFDPAALEVTGISLEDLRITGKPPIEAMQEFYEWVSMVAGNSTPVFVGFNAAFDWSFVNYYFHRFLGQNPFGFSALDIKSLYMGAMHCSWSDTRSSKIVKSLGIQEAELSHQALDDARVQAKLFLAVRSL